MKPWGEWYRKFYYNHIEDVIFVLASIIELAFIDMEASGVGVLMTKKELTPTKHFHMEDE